MSSDIMSEAQVKIEKYIEIGHVEESEKWPAIVEEATMMQTGVIKDLIEGASNTYSRDVIGGAFKTALRTTHRQHQADFWEIMLRVIKEHGEDKDGRNFDSTPGRNMHIKELCQRITLAAEDPRTLKLLQDDRNERYGRS